MQIAVIAKEPVPGRVKTRLCPPFSFDDAAELAAAALGDTLARVADTPARRRVLVLDGEPGPWVPDRFDVIGQRGEGLGERLDAAFIDCISSCPEPVVLVGMDTPQITAQCLLEAGAMLERPGSLRRRAVLGPATDGGYWLIGLSKVVPNLFDGVAMSVSTTLAEQSRQLRRHHFEIGLLEELTDVDTVADAMAVARMIPDSRFAHRLRSIYSMATVA